MLLVEPHGELGGAQDVILRLAAGADRQLFDPYLLFLSEGETVENACRLGIPTECITLQRTNLSTTARVRALIHYLRALRPDVVHNDAMPQLLPVTLATRLRRVPLVWHQQDPIRPDSPGVQRFLRLVNRVPPQATVFGTQVARDTIAPNIPRLRRASLVINGVDPPESFMPTEEARRRASLPTEGRLVSMFGRLVEHKHNRLLINAAPTILAAHPDVHFVMVGPSEASFAHELREHAASLGVTDRVHLTGAVAEDLKWGLLAGSSVLVHASSYEPFGLVLVEAMLAGAPVVAARAWGPTEIVDNGRTGLLFDIGDLAALERSVERMLSDPALRDLVVEQARESAHERFSFERSLRQVENVWTEVARPSSGRRTPRRNASGSTSL